MAAALAAAASPRWRRRRLCAVGGGTGGLEWAPPPPVTARPPPPASLRRALSLAATRRQPSSPRHHLSLVAADAVAERSHVADILPPCAPVGLVGTVPDARTRAPLLVGSLVLFLPTEFVVACGRYGRSWCPARGRWNPHGKSGGAGSRGGGHPS